MTREGSPSGVPLQARSPLLWLFGALCALYASLPYIIVPSRFRDAALVDDFANYWSAGATAGTYVLTNDHLLAAWQTAHHLAVQPFVYPPAFAWVYTPLARLSPVQALVSEQCGMIVIFGMCAFLIARIYRFERWFAAVAVFAWGPVITAIESGQNTGIGLLLTLCAILALVERKTILLGAAVGLLLYKPTDTAGLLVLLIARREWRALAIAALGALAWFVASAYAAGDDWSWASTYVATIRDWYALHSGANPLMVFTVPTIMLAHGIPVAFALIASGAVLILSIPILRRLSALEAGSFAPLLGLAASVHAWSYTAALMLPALCLLMRKGREPWRTSAIAVAYVLAAVGVSMSGGGIALSVLCLGGVTVALIATRRPQRWLSTPPGPEMA